MRKRNKIKSPSAVANPILGEAPEPERPLCINIYRSKRNNFSLQEANGGKHLYDYCHPQKRCPSSFIQCIYNYCHLQKKCPLHHPWKNLSGFKMRLIAVYIHVWMSFEIIFDSDYLFCT